MNRLLDLDLFDIVAPIVIGAFMVLWLYCMWFANKYDKDPNSTRFLFLFNLFYVPIYLQRMRTLKNAQKIEKISEEIYDHEFIQQSRMMILDIIELWSSKDLQLSLRDNFEDNRVAL